MSSLLKTLEQLAWLSPDARSKAVRRQRIYGASLDTNLFELELLTLAQLEELLSRSTGLPIPSRERLAPLGSPKDSEERPWSRVPDSRSFTPWVAPLHHKLGVLELAVHPEIPDEEFARLKLALPRAELSVVPECVLVALQSERRSYVGSPRFHVLNRSYLRYLREQSHDSTKKPVAKSGSSTKVSDANELGASRIDLLDRARGSKNIQEGCDAIDRCTSISELLNHLIETLSLICHRGTILESSTPGGDYAPFRSFGAPQTQRGLGSPQTNSTNETNLLPRRLIKSNPTRLENLDLRLALAKEDASACLFIPLTTAQRDLLVYLDCGDESLTTPDTEAVFTLILRANRRARVLEKPRSSVSSLEQAQSDSPLHLDQTQAIQSDPPQSGRHLDDLRKPGSSPDLSGIARTAAIETRKSAPPPPRREWVRRPPPPRLRDNRSNEESQVLLPEGLTNGQNAPRLVLEANTVPEVQAAAQSILMINQIDRLLDDIMQGTANPSAIRTFGQLARNRVAERFPGPLEIVGSSFDDLPPLEDHGPLIRIALEIDPPLSSELLPKLRSPSAIIRFYAAAMFHPIRDERVVPGLCRLVFDPDAGVRTVAARVLETYSDSALFQHTIPGVRQELYSQDPIFQRYAVLAVGSLRDTESVASLIDLLPLNADASNSLQDITLQALASITGQRLGPAPEPWCDWWEQNRQRHRIDWLIDALVSSDAAMRFWIDAELCRLTGHSRPPGEESQKPLPTQRVTSENAEARNGRSSSTQAPSPTTSAGPDLSAYWAQWWHEEGRFHDLR